MKPFIVKSTVPEIVRSEKSAHYYGSEGQPLFTVPYADPSKGSRNTTIADCRRMKLFPSVTGIIDVCNRCDFQFIPMDVLDLGTTIHLALEKYIILGSINRSFAPILVSVGDWLKKARIKPHIAEKTINPKLGYGGSLDLMGVDMNNPCQSPVFIDWKTTKTKKRKSFKVPLSYLLQIDAYARAEGCPTARKIIVYISSDEIGKIIPIEVVTDSYHEELFNSCYKVYVLANKLEHLKRYIK